MQHFYLYFKLFDIEKPFLYSVFFGGSLKYSIFKNSFLLKKESLDNQELNGQIQFLNKKNRKESTAADVMMPMAFLCINIEHKN